MAKKIKAEKIDFWRNQKHIVCTRFYGVFQIRSALEPPKIRIPPHSIQKYFAPSIQENPSNF